MWHILFISKSIATAGHFKPTNPSQHTSHTHHSKEQEIINQQNINNHPIDRYSIESTSNASIYSLNLNYANVKEPVIIRGAGNITIFGVCNKFNEQFPTQLNAKLAPEEFRDTIKQINNILSRGLLLLSFSIKSQPSERLGRIMKINKRLAIWLLSSSL